MRIGGLASGIDTESIIKDLMKAQRIPLDKVTQKKQYFEWQLNDYRSANRDLKAYSTKLFDNSILSKNFNQKNVTVSSPDDISIKSKGNSEDFSGTIRVDQLATNATLQGGAVDGELMSGKELGISGKIVITAPYEKTGDSKPIEIDLVTGDTMKDVLKKINEKSDVRAFFDEKSGRIGFTAKQSGGDAKVDANGVITASENSYIKIESTNSELITKLGLNTPNSVGQPGFNAKLNYNGMDIERTSNTFDLDGMEFTLKAVSTKEITFNSTTDTEKVFESIKGFVDDYNKLIEDLNKKIREPKYRNFQPLSTEQKADMKEKEIELWEEKAMSGTLRNDPEITKLLSEMRNILTKSVKIGEELVDGKPSKDIKISLSDLGITTSGNYLDHGKLVIDEKKLKAAISENPQGVEKLFNNEGETTTGTPPVTTNQGIARMLRTAVDATQTSIQKSAGKIGDSNKAFSLGRTLDAMNKQIENFESRMQMVESRYWKQFNAMENAIQRANAQSASLMSALGGGA